MKFCKFEPDEGESCPITNRDCPVGPGDIDYPDCWEPDEPDFRYYCTQNGGECKTCSLSNYGRDCQNKLI